MRKNDEHLRPGDAAQLLDGAVAHCRRQVLEKIMCDRPVIRPIDRVDVLNVADPEIDTWEHLASVVDVRSGEVEPGVVQQRRQPISAENR